MPFSFVGWILTLGTNILFSFIMYMYTKNISKIDSKMSMFIHRSCTLLVR